VKWGVDVQQAVSKATATDANTVVVDFKIPSPRFFFFMTYKYDIGVYIVPKHIFDGQDWTTFKHFDIAKGWPVSTGPWQVTNASLQQKVFDRRPTWWAAEAGLAPLPQVLRNIWLPGIGEQQMAQAMITNQTDASAAGDVPDDLSAERQDHHPCRPQAAVRLCRLVADFLVCQ
jgi:peptide/nickel transport system substrate-binding protein